MTKQEVHVVAHKYVPLPFVWLQTRLCAHQRLLGHVQQSLCICLVLTRETKRSSRKIGRKPPLSQADVQKKSQQGEFWTFVAARIRDHPYMKLFTEISALEKDNNREKAEELRAELDKLIEGVSQDPK